MFKPTRVIVSVSLLFVAVLLFVSVIYTGQSHSGPTRALQVNDLTPWLYLPFVSSPFNPAVTK